ncbi:MAG: metalloregulator ArsR/SmtB family transcription factor [Bacteroidota bacterium]
MPNKKIFELQAEACKALAHPLRLEIIHLLKDRELGFSELLERTGALKSGLSQHLSIMVERGILTVRKDSRSSFYTLSSPKVGKACGIMREVMADHVERQRKILMS